MTKRYHPFNYFITWLGLLRVSIGVSCIIGCYFLFVSDEPLVLRIFGCLMMIIGVFGCLVEGLPNIKEGIKKAKRHSQDFILGRDKPDLSFTKRDDIDAR